MTSGIALTAALATPAMADITAADVLSNQQALYESIGITLSGALDGDTLSNPQMNAIFPMDAGSFQITADDVSMVSNGDGTVTITLPSPMNLTFSGGFAGEGSIAMGFTLTHDGYTIQAAGDPGDISYQTNGQSLRVELTEYTVEEAFGVPYDMTGVFTIDSWLSESTVTEGNLISYTSTTETGNTVAAFTTTIDNVISKSSQTSLPVSTSTTALFPVGGADLMNLSAALRDGLSLELVSNGGGSTSATETLLDGAPFNSQSTSTGPQSFSVAIDADGFRADGEAQDFAMTMFNQMIFPGELDFAMSGVSVNYDIPLNASPEPQDFRIATSMTGITLGDAIWALFDPAGQLPRDPAAISFDVTGFGTTGMDFLDFMAMGEMFGPPPITVDEVTIENLRIAAAGAEATAQGAMTLDWTDFQTVPGMPRPEGQVTVNLNGANGLMDNLVAMGLIPEADLMMPRMMLGMFATPVGDDQLQTVLEVNEEGHVLANGQRLQ
ncbi:MAG: DUF2125 domain-containing protein [Pseudomonadota bacterium]